MSHPNAVFEARRPSVHDELTNNPRLVPITATELIDLGHEVLAGCRTVSVHTLHRAAKAIELGRLREWDLSRRLTISEAARAAEVGDPGVADDDQDAEVLDLDPATVQSLKLDPPNFLAQIAAALPAGTRCSIHLEHERASAPCSAGIVPAAMKISPC